MGGNEFIPSTLVAVLLGIEACMMENILRKLDIFPTSMEK